jgi:dihydrodipicolinate synthase/N-acetylneuraminate lyase
MDTKYTHQTSATSSTSSAPLTGVLPIIPTIFNDSGNIDEVGTRNVLEYVVSCGASGVVFPGLASEYDHLTKDERLHMTAKLGEWISGRVPFVIGASAADIGDAQVYAVAAANAGAQSVMVLTPHALANDLSALARFYDTIATVCGLPVMLQNAPPPMGIGLALEKVAELARIVPGIRSVKEEALPSGQRITKLTALAGDVLDAVYGGAGARHLIDELRRGARGTMPACEITELHVHIEQFWQQGRYDDARLLYERTLPLLTMQAVFRWRLTKAVLKRRGLIESDFTRAPGPALDAQDEQELTAILNRLSDVLPWVRG